MLFSLVLHKSIPNPCILLRFSSISIEGINAIEIMAMFIRAKRVSDPLDDRIKALLFNGESSSGSEHDADGSCLSDLVHAFFDPDEQTVTDASDMTDSTSTDDDGDVTVRHIACVNDALAAFGKCDPFRDRLRWDAMEVMSGLKVSGPGCRRVVMAGLRERGHNAGICKVKWEKSGGLTAGSYEYVDVVTFGDDGRYIVDLDFKSQFEVARATVGYERLLALLPSVMVGRLEEVKRVVRTMADAAESSLRVRELSVPPWRKRRYMVNKWFGPHRRTTNPLPSTAAVADAGRSREIQHCVTGFVSVGNA